MTVPDESSAEGCPRGWRGLDKLELLLIMNVHFGFLFLIPLAIKQAMQTSSNKLVTTERTVKNLNWISSWVKFLEVILQLLTVVVLFALIVLSAFVTVSAISVYLNGAGSMPFDALQFMFGIFPNSTWEYIPVDVKSFTEISALELTWYYLWVKIILDVLSSWHALIFMELKNIKKHGEDFSLISKDPAELFASGIVSPPSYPFLWFLVRHGLLADHRVWLLCDFVRTIFSDMFNLHGRAPVQPDSKSKDFKLGTGLWSWMKSCDKIHPIVMIILTAVEFVDVLAVAWWSKLVPADMHTYDELAAVNSSQSWMRKQGLYMVFVCLPALVLTAKFHWKRAQVAGKHEANRDSTSVPEWMKYTQIFHPLFGWCLTLHDSFVQVHDGNTDDAVEDYKVVVYNFAAGGQGNVHLVQTGDGRILALKEFMKNKMDARDKALLDKEIDVLKSHKHVNIVRYIDYHKELPVSNNPGLFLEYIRMSCDVEGGTLTHWCEANPLPATGADKLRRERLELCYQILKGIEYLHSNGIAHRDLKPDNVLVGLTDQDRRIAKLTDFGCATPSAVGQTHIGTTSFVAPEVQVAGGEGDRYDTKISDIWSVGAMVFWALTDHMIFEGNDAMHDRGRRKVFRLLKMTTDGREGFQNVVERTMPKKDIRESDSYKEVVKGDKYKEFFEAVFVGPDSRATASDLLRMSLFDEVRDSLEKEIWHAH
uniref:non-specific serine/threonine protein kinase n=2 Tax=Palpitomonas bilix TaxID=652834 RepID=A0A7S3GGF7_9EUKA